MPRGVYSKYICTEKHKKFIPQEHQEFIRDYFIVSPFKGLLLYHRLGSGKCFSRDTPIMMFDGSIKKVQNIAVGNKVMGDDSTPRTVLNLSTGIDDMYEVKPAKGDSYTVNSRHVLSLKYSCNASISKRKDQPKKQHCVSYFYKERLTLNARSFSTREDAEFYDSREYIYIDIPIEQYLQLSTHGKAYLKGYRVTVNFPERQIQFDPYVLGIWLGNDSPRNPVISNQNAILKYLRNELCKLDLMLVYSGYNYGIGPIKKGAPNLFLKALQHYKLINNKYIPDDYKYNSRAVRLQILAGLLDSDGYYKQNTYNIVQKNKRLAFDIVYLCRSLGFAAYIKQCEKRIGLCHRICISGAGLEKIPVKKRKKAHEKRQIKNALITGITVTKKGQDRYYGFEVDGNHRFLLGDFTVTHNSCSGIITADVLLKDNTIKTVYVLSPGSLRQNWINEYCNVCGAVEKWLTDHYTFITYNYNVANYLPNNFNDSLVIIDEVHNFINGVKNRSKNAVAIYTKLMISDCRILALSGTPIFNNIFEWSILGNLLKPGSMPTVISGNELYTASFMDLFNIDDEGFVTPKDPDAFKKAVVGIVSYFPGLGGKFYPEVIYEPIVKAKMSEYQEAAFWDKFDDENKWLKPINPHLKTTDPKKYEFLKRMFVIAKKRIISRQPSNFAYPLMVYEGSGIEDWEKPKDALFPYGWVEPKYFSDGQLKKQYSPKMAALFDNILKNFRGKHMVFTFFKEHSGVNLMKTIFKMCGLRTEVFSGDLSDKGRSKLLREFNSPKNRYGDVIKVIFVTDAGAEGITLLETGHVHILESDPRENKIQQAIGRAVRFKSHTKMPLDEQQVHIWRYWSVSGEDFDPKIKKIGMKIEKPSDRGKIEKTIDERLYEEGQKKMNTINSFLQLLIDNSIEKE